MSVAVSTWNNATWDWDFVGDIPESACLSVAAASGLSMAHIFPRQTLPDGWSWLRPEFSETQSPVRPARVEAWVGGSLLTTRRVKAGAFKQVGGGKRGSITTFTRASRRRLMQMIAKLRRNVFPVFVTLTYPAEYSTDPTEWKRHLKVFWQRMQRKWSRASFVWRLEFQKRGAPHFHLLVFGVGYKNLREWVSQTWYEVVASGDEKHLRAGTRVERIRSFKQVMRYASKELGKVGQVVNDYGGVGRWWGCYGRTCLPWADLVLWAIRDKDALKLMRWLRRFASLPARGYKSLSVFCDAEFWHNKIRGPDPPGDFLTWSREFQKRGA